jgi:hypothetical protein
MPHARIPIWLALPCAALLLVTAQARAQSGPAVQVFTSATTGQTRIMPLERLPFAVTVSASAGYDTNVGTSSGTQLDSFFSSASVRLTYGFGTERTRASMSWGAGITYYANDAGSSFDYYSPDSSLQVNFTHEVSERLSLSGGVFAKYGMEPDFFTGVGENRRTGNFFYTSDSIAASYRWYERFSTVTSYSIGILSYEDDDLGSALNRYDHSISQQFRFMLLPMTTVIGDYRVSFVDYASDGRDAHSQFFLLGASQTLGPRLQGSFFAGAQLRSSELENAESFGPYVSGSLSFVVGEKTALSWSAQYSTEESNIIQATGRKSFSTGLQLSYGLTPRISSSLSAYYRHDENTLPEVFFFVPGRGIFSIRPTFAEESVDIGMNLSYGITPRLSASAGVHYTEVWSEFSTRPYSRARYSGGISYSF